MTIKKKALIIALWVAFFTLVRILYYLFGYSGAVSDKYGFYSLALFNLERGEWQLSSGLGFEYINVLSDFIGIFGENVKNIFALQVIFEMAAMLFFLLGFMKIWGIRQALFSCSVLAVSPVFIDLLRVVSPEEFFLFAFSIYFFAVSVYYKYTRTHFWTRCLKNELLVISLGIYIGILMAWNYLGIIALIMFVFVAAKNSRILKDKFQLQLMVEKDVEEKDLIMSLPSQLIHLFIGLILGMFFTLLKFTGYTGFGITDQFLWWCEQLKKLPNRTMDFNSFAAMWFIASMMLALLINELFVLRQKRIDNEKIEMEEMIRPLLLEQEKAFVDRDNIKSDSTSSEYFIAPDGRKIKYLENPLPLPKKHKKHDMKFDLNQIEKENLEFVLDNDSNKIPETNMNMRNAAVGIESVVKLPPKEENWNVVDPLDMYETKSWKVDDFRDIDDFDIDIKSNDDFDI